MCVCPPDSKIKYSVFYAYLCSCQSVLTECFFTDSAYLGGQVLCSRKANLYVIHRQYEIVYSVSRLFDATWVTTAAKYLILD